MYNIIKSKWEKGWHILIRPPLNKNDIARIKIKTTTPLFFDSYRKNRNTGSFILIDESNNNTVGAGIIV